MIHSGTGTVRPAPGRGEPVTGSPARMAGAVALAAIGGALLAAWFASRRGEAEVERLTRARLGG